MKLWRHLLHLRDPEDALIHLRTAVVEYGLLARIRRSLVCILNLQLLLLLLKLLKDVLFGLVG